MFDVPDCTACSAEFNRQLINIVFPCQGTIYIYSKKCDIFNHLNLFIVTIYYYINTMTIFVINCKK